MALKFNGLEVLFYYDFNPMVEKSWINIKFGLITIHEKGTGLTQGGPMTKKRGG